MENISSKASNIAADSRASVGNVIEKLTSIIQKIETMKGAEITVQAQNQNPKYTFLVRWLFGSYRPNVSDMLKKNFITLP